MGPMIEDDITPVFLINGFLLFFFCVGATRVVILCIRGFVGFLFFFFNLVLFWFFFWG